MANPSDLQAANLLRERLVHKYGEWSGRIRVETVGDVQTVALDVPGYPGHRLSVAISRSEATVAYSDGRPPGPAEKLFIWGNNPASDGVDAVCQFVEALVQGHVVLVRERVSRLIRFFRGNTLESLLQFVPAAELPRWSVRRRRAIVRAWTWDAGRKLAI